MNLLISLPDPPDAVVVGDFMSLKEEKAEVVSAVFAQWFGGDRKVTLAVRTTTLAQATELGDELRRGDFSSMCFIKSPIILLEKLQSTPDVS